MAMDGFISGTIMALSVVVGLFQLRSWRKTRERLFLFFALSFFLMAVNRFALSMVGDESESRTYFYVIRLFAFVLILYAVWDKNRRARVTTPPKPSP